MSKKISIRLDQEVFCTLEELKDKCNLDVSKIIRTILEDYVKMYNTNKILSHE